MFTALFQLLQSLDMNVLAGTGDLAFEIDPAACQLGGLKLSGSKFFKLLFHDGGGRGVKFVFFNGVLFFELVLTCGSDDEIGVIELFECEF